jgi:hypothetical protein
LLQCGGLLLTHLARYGALSAPADSAVQSLYTAWRTILPTNANGGRKAAVLDVDFSRTEEAIGRSGRLLLATIEHREMTGSVKGFGCRPDEWRSHGLRGPACESLQGRKPREWIRVNVPRTLSYRGLKCAHNSDVTARTLLNGDLMFCAS